MSKQNILIERIKLRVQQGGATLPFFKRYTLWKRVLRNNPSQGTLDFAARALSYYGLTPTDGDGVEGELLDMGYPKRDPLTMLYILAPKVNTHKIVADSLEIATLRWAGVPLSSDDAATYCPLADPALVNAALDADMDGFMSRPGYSKTRQQVRDNFAGEGNRFFSDESVRKALERRKSDSGTMQNYETLKIELTEWIASLTEEERIEYIVEILNLLDLKDVLKADT